MSLPQERPKYTDIIGETPGLASYEMALLDDSEYEYIRYSKSYPKFYIDESNMLVEGKSLSDSTHDTI